MRNERVLKGQYALITGGSHWTFTIPKAIRGLFERERRLLGLLSRTAYEAVRRSFRALFARKDVRPGRVISIQTFGSYGANFNPYCHAIISDGVRSAEGAFLELPSLRYSRGLRAVSPPSSAPLA